MVRTQILALSFIPSVHSESTNSTTTSTTTLTTQPLDCSEGNTDDRCEPRTCNYGSDESRPGKCTLPFRYNGQWHHKCTTDTAHWFSFGGTLPWCQTGDEEVRTFFYPPGWAECDLDSECMDDEFLSSKPAARVPKTSTNATAVAVEVEVLETAGTEQKEQIEETGATDAAAKVPEETPTNTNAAEEKPKEDSQGSQKEETNQKEQESQVVQVNQVGQDSPGVPAEVQPSNAGSPAATTNTTRSSAPKIGIVSLLGLTLLF